MLFNNQVFNHIGQNMVKLGGVFRGDYWRTGVGINLRSGMTGNSSSCSGYFKILLKVAGCLSFENCDVLASANIFSISSSVLHALLDAASIPFGSQPLASLYRLQTLIDPLAGITSA